MAFNSIYELNLYALGSLDFTTDVQTIIPEGTKVALNQPTWDWVRTTGNIQGNNVVFTHETIDTLAGNVTISFDDYNSNEMNTNIIQDAGNITITGLNTAQDWTGATLYLDVPADYYGNIEFVSTVTNTNSNIMLQWNQNVVWENRPELDVPEEINYQYFETGANDWSIGFWFYNTNVAPTEASSGISTWPVTLHLLSDLDVTLSVANWAALISAYGNNYVYFEYDQVLFDFRDPGLAQWDPGNDQMVYLVVNNGPDVTSANTGISVRLCRDKSGPEIVDTISSLRGISVLPRQTWTHKFFTFNISLINLVLQGGNNGTIFFYTNGEFNTSTSGYIGGGPNLSLGRSIFGTHYLTGYLEDFNIRNKTYTTYASPDFTTNYNFSPGPTASIEPTLYDQLLLTADSLVNLTLNDLPNDGRNAINLTLGGNLSSYTTTTAKNRASIFFNGNQYITVDSADLSLNPQTGAGGGITEFTDNLLAFVRDDENQGEYNLNVNSNHANLVFNISTEVAGANLNSLTGAFTGNITLEGSRKDINGHLKTMYLKRVGNIAGEDRVGNITWTLTPDDSREVTQLNQSRNPLFNSELTGEDRLYLQNSNLGRAKTLAYVGVDTSSNPVFAYATVDLDNLTLTTLKTNYLSGELSFGNLSVILNDDDYLADSVGRAAIVGSRQHVNLGNTINDNNNISFLVGSVVSESGPDSYISGNVVIDCDTLEITSSDITNTQETTQLNTNSSLNHMHFRQLPQGVANSWIVHPFVNERTRTVDEVFAGFNYANVAQNREDYTGIFTMGATMTYAGSDICQTIASPVVTNQLQLLDNYSTALGGKKKLITATKTLTFTGDGNDEPFVMVLDDATITLRGALAESVEDDSNINTTYMTNILNSTNDRFFATGGAYTFNDDPLEHYVSVQDSRFAFPARPTITTAVVGNVSSGGDNLAFNNGSVAITYDQFFFDTNQNFNIEISVWVDAPGTSPLRHTIITNSTDVTIGAEEFSISCNRPSPGALNFRWNYRGTIINTTSGYVTNTWYKLNLIRVSNVIRLYINDQASGASITNSASIGGAGHDTFYLGKTNTANPVNGATEYLKGKLKNLSLQKQGDYIFSAALNSTTITYNNYINSDFLIEMFIKFYDTDDDQIVISNMSDPTDTLASPDFLLIFKDTEGVNKKLRLETYGQSNNGSMTLTYGNWYHIAIQRKSNELIVYVNGETSTILYDVDYAIGGAGQNTFYLGVESSTNYLNASVDAFRVANVARFTTISGGFIPQFVNRNLSPVGAYVNGRDANGVFNILPYLATHWSVNLAGTLTQTDFTSIGGGARYGEPYIFDRAYFNAAIGPWALVYGGSDSRAYLIYSKAVVTENVYDRYASRGLFYRKISISDNLTITLGNEVTVIAEIDSDLYGSTIAADAIKLGVNMFINIIISDRHSSNNNAHAYALKFLYN